MRKSLEVTGKPLTYATRRMQPGDIFTASQRDARLLIRMKRAREHREPVALPPPPVELLAKFDQDGDGKVGGSIAQPKTAELTALRKAYKNKFGKQAFNGWDAATLAAKLAET